MRDLVTGGAGFIGSHLCRRLLASGRDVVCLDNFHTGSRSNVASLLQNPRFELIEHDVIAPIEVTADQIYNLACPASPRHYQEDPIQTIRTCVLGADCMLNLARSIGARILQASTSEVYGDPSVNPQDESYWGHVNPVGVRACYDEGKRCAETLFFDHHRQYGVEIKVMRIFNVYGPQMRVDDGRVVSNFIVQALRGEPLTIFGDGQQTRSFCYIDDLVEGMCRFMDSEAGLIGPINIGNPNQFTILDLADRVLSQIGGPSKLVHLPLPQDDPRQRQPDISRAQSALDWTPSVQLDDGLRETIKYFRRILAA